MVRKKKEVEEFVPEVVDEGVVRDQEKENPIAGLENEVIVRHPGAWKKVSHDELAQLEASGQLLGYDQKTGEVLLKEEK